MSIHKTAAEMDRANGLDDESKQKALHDLKEYEKKRIQAFNLMKRSEDNPPSTMDKKWLDQFLWQYRKDDTGREGTRV